MTKNEAIQAAHHWRQRAEAQLTEVTDERDRLKEALRKVHQVASQALLSEPFSIAEDTVPLVKICILIEDVIEVAA